MAMLCWVLTPSRFFAMASPSFAQELAQGSRLLFFQCCGEEEVLTGWAHHLSQGPRKGKDR